MQKKFNVLISAIGLVALAVSPALAKAQQHGMVPYHHRTAHPEFAYRFGANASGYAGPIYNPEGQVIGTYRGPILGYSTSCNVLTPVGYLYICQNFTW